MNCIFCCIFNQEKYIELFNLLIESIFIYGNLDENTHILIYTSTAFMKIIKRSHLFNKDIMIFEINDTYNDIDKACKSRLDLFDLPSIKNYNKILYLDTDIIVKDDVNKVFNVCNLDILYVLEEGNINDDSDFWGKTLFNGDFSMYQNTSAFTSGIMLFNNCENVKRLFYHIKEHINNCPYNFECHDQPYIVYNAFKYNMYNNTVLKSLVVNNDDNIESNKVIHHFPGGPGVYHHKIVNMNTFLNNMKDFTININIDNTKRYIDDYLLPIIIGCGEVLEGNMLMFYTSYEYPDYFINKVKNISNLVLNKNIRNVMEIGFNAGFSSLLMLLSNPHLTITCVDLGEHTYTMSCFNQLKKTFGERINIIIDDSTKTLKNITNVYDLIHIYGGPSLEVANNNIINSYRLSKPGTILIMDEYEVSKLHELWESYIIKYNLKSLDINVYNCEYHDIKYVSVNNISKVLFQTNKIPHDDVVLDMINSMLPSDWKYEFYNDTDVIQFFSNNPLTEYPDIITKYNSMPTGAHKADIFRYYYLYINGGFFMDSDAMLYVNIEQVVKNYNFVSVNSSCVPNSIFQGILGVSPKNEVIKQALHSAYNTDPTILINDYHYLCKILYNIIYYSDCGYNIKLYNERRISNQDGDDIVEGDTILFKHYWLTKVIPTYKPQLLGFDTNRGKIYLNENDCYMVDVFKNNKYWYEDTLFQLINNFIPSDKNILEIGGHCGTSSIFHSRFLKENNVIYIFEPQQQMFDILNKNIEVNNLYSKIKTFKSAVFCKNGFTHMNSSDIDGTVKGNIKILENNNKPINYGGISLGKNGELVDCIKLDDLDFENIGYLRCDAQGSEPFIFSTATQFIKKHRPVILYKDIEVYGTYLFDIVKSSYPEFSGNSNFNVKEYCVNELGYYCIPNFNYNMTDTLLLPYLHTNWNNFNRSELHTFDYRILNTYTIPNPCVRIGPQCDGGYVIADGFEYDLFISCGISDDVRFEEEFLDIHKIKCYAFDGTINTFPLHRNDMEWIPKNVGYLNTEKVTNLKEYINGNNKIFLKMDIEGSEFNWLDSMTETELDCFSQIVMEIHCPFDIYRMNMIKKLNNTHYIIHIHGNNYCDRDIAKDHPCPPSRSYDGTVNIVNDKLPQIKIPEVFEVTYINKKLFDSSLIKTKVMMAPTKLDYPNNPHLPDMRFSIPNL